MDCVPLQLFLLNIMSIKTNVNVASNNEILISCKMKETLSKNNEFLKDLPLLLTSIKDNGIVSLGIHSKRHKNVLHLQQSRSMNCNKRPLRKKII